MLGRVHIVDDDASFPTAMERRLKHAGYEVATYPSALHLLLICQRKRSELHPPRCAVTGIEWPGTSDAAKRTRLYAADHIPHWLSRHSDHRAGHQGGCG